MSISVGTTYSSSGASVSSLTYSVTVAATANNVLVVTFCARAGGAQTISSVTFNGVAMTQAVYVDDNGGNRNVEGGTYYAVGVTATTANVVVTMSGACQALYSEAVPIYGASGLGATSSLYQGSATSNTDSVTTTKANSVIVGSAIKAGGGGSGETLTDNGGQTTWGKVSIGTNPNNSQSAAAYVSATTIGSYSIGWSWTTNTENVGTVVEIKEYTAVASSGAFLFNMI